jgi:hypothetical protein
MLSLKSLLLVKSLVGLVVAGLVAGNALAVNCSKKCDHPEAIEWKTGAGVWWCRYPVEGSDAMCASSIYTGGGYDDRGCVNDEPTSLGDVSRKDCQGSEVCSTSCTNTNDTDEVKATKGESDGTNCTSITHDYRKTCEEVAS